MSAFIRKNLTFFTFNHASYKDLNFCTSPVSLFLPQFFSTLNPNPNNVYDILVHKHHFPCEFSSQVASQLGDIKNPEKVNSMLSFLKSIGFSTSQLQKFIKWRPILLCYNLEHNVKPKIKAFQELGFSPSDISMMISACPIILASSLNNCIIPSLSILKSLMGSNAALLKAVRRSPRLLTSNLKKTLEPNLEILKGCGVSVDRVHVVFNGGHGNAFISKPEVIIAAVEKTREMRITVSSKTFIYGVLTITSMSSKGLESKMRAFREAGFSDSDILHMFHREPLVLAVSTDKMKKVAELLVGTGKYDASSIVGHPLVLNYSIKARYEPRLRVLGVLVGKGLIEDWPSLRTLCKLTDDQFCKRFVSPYLDHLSDDCIPKV
ncbi:transcription termination factor MTERF6, chloroplastic/mitochondrial-like [Salvia divinorum]|uniref:Transcription termination factor MTERF6, chloroplastic/mitochondrial-like n=1 Tax=Salvia divinorum TaxID=28513 RepID=A0ABD1G8T1_SALDI